jgi:hypothetical protein
MTLNLTGLATAKDFLAVQIEGKRQLQRRPTYDSLDAAISVGYRVNFTNATGFTQS